MPTPDALILALDAGGSSTRCMLARSDGTVLGRARAGPGNHILDGLEVARTSIAAAIGQIDATAAVRIEAIDYAVAASAGVGAHGEGREVVEALLVEVLPGRRVRAIGDMVAAFWGALRGGVGVVVAAGTGSVGYGRNAAGETRQVGGWGQIMGDEGSAYDIAVRALRAGARATDGRGPHTQLTEQIVAALGVGNFIEVALRVYGEPMTRDAIAALAATVAAAAARGDGVAHQVLADAGTELGVVAVTTLRTLGLGDSAAPVAYTGAVFEAGGSLLSAFRQTVTAACLNAVITAAEFTPVVGAFKVALEDLGLAFTPQIAATLRAGLGPDTP